MRQFILLGVLVLFGSARRAMYADGFRDRRLSRDGNMSRNIIGSGIELISRAIGREDPLQI